MKSGSKDWQQLIVNGAAQLGIDVGLEHTAKFAVHVRELEMWNRKVNLTAITDPVNTAVKHFLDAIVPSPLIPDGASLLDIGSGAGFPGIPLKVLNPSLSVVLVDASRKKVNFQRHVIRVLGLKDIEARHIRAEEMGRLKAFENAFDVIVSRALTAMDAFVSLAEPLLKKNGRIIALKGKVDPAEVASVQGLPLRGASDVAGSFNLTVRRYRLPIVQSDRSLLILWFEGV